MRIHSIFLFFLFPMTPSVNCLSFYTQGNNRPKEIKRESSQLSDDFMLINTQTNFARPNQSKYGYYSNSLSVYTNYSFPYSNLNILTIHSEFIPGAVAHAVGLSGYSSSALNERGSLVVSISANDPQNNNGLHVKDYWPINDPGTVTIVSSINSSFNFGVSTNDGFSPSIGGELSFNYSKTITVPEPLLSAQSISSTSKSWTYDYERASKQTYHIFAGIMFETHKTIDPITINAQVRTSETVHIDKFFNWEQEIFNVGQDTFNKTFTIY